MRINERNRRRRAMFYYMSKRRAYNRGKKEGRRKGAIAGISGTLAGVGGGFALQNKILTAAKKSRLNKEFDESLRDPFTASNKWSKYYNGNGVVLPSIKERFGTWFINRYNNLPIEEKLKYLNRLKRAEEIALKIRNTKNSVKDALTGETLRRRRIQRIARKAVADASKNMKNTTPLRKALRLFT